MALSSETVRLQFSGDGSTTSFAISYIFWDADDLLVVHTDSAGTETTWVRGTQYTVTGGNGSTGTIEVETSPTDYTPASGETLTVKSDRSVLQPTSLPVAGSLPSASIEQALDQAVRLVQQQAESLGRAVKFAVSSSSSDIDFPDPSSGKSLRWNTAGDGLENASATDGGDITLPLAVVDGGTGAATVAAARTNLAVPGLSVNNSMSGANTYSGDNAHTGKETFTGEFVLTKGSDIASAATIVIPTDGNYFDVTGTTAITGMTVDAGRFFILQFDGVLTFTDGASLTLPGNANITTAAGDHALCYATAANTVVVINYMRALQQPGTHVVQVASSQDGAVATGTTTIPDDDTIPQSTEGDEYLTVSITPKSASNTLIVDVSVNLAHSAATSTMFAALFQDSTAAALASAMASKDGAANARVNITFRHKMTAGTTSATTFKVRCGSPTAGTTTFNGVSGTRVHGGVMASSITVTEIAA